MNEDWPVAVLGYYFTGKGAGQALNADLDQDGIVDGDFKATTATTEIGLGARKWLEEGEAVTLFVEAGLVSISATAKGYQPGKRSVTF